MRDVFELRIGRTRNVYTSDFNEALKQAPSSRASEVFWVLNIFEISTRRPSNYAWPVQTPGIGRCAQLLGVRTLTRAACHDALPPLLIRQARHEVVRAADFEAEDLLQVLPLEPYLVP